MSQSIALVRYDAVSESEFSSYTDEWEASGEVIVPSSADRKGRGFKEMRVKWAADETDQAFASGFVPSTLFFLTGPGGRILGAIHLRHVLNDRLRLHGGHIGYGIRPSERRKGYGALMLGRLLDLVKARGWDRVLLTCDEDNLGSRKTIEKAGGVLEDRGEFEGAMTRRYWIEANRGSPITCPEGSPWPCDDGSPAKGRSNLTSGDLPPASDDDRAVD